MLAFFVFDVAEFEVGVGELGEDSVGGSGDFALHGEEAFLFFGENVGFVAQEAFELEAVVFEGGGFGVAIERFFGEGLEFGRNEAGGLSGAGGDEGVLLHHALIGAVADVFGLFEEGVGAEAFGEAVKVAVEVKAVFDGFGGFSECAAKGGEGADLFVPFFEGGLPGGIAFEELA